MVDQAPESLRSLVCALDIIFLFISLSTSCTPLLWSSWTYKKGQIMRRDLWIAIFRAAGLVFSIVNLVRGPRRHTLSLRIILALVVGPMDVKIIRLAWRTLGRAADVQESQEMGPQQPMARNESTTPVPRSRQVVAVINPHSYRPWKRSSCGHACSFLILWVFADGIFLNGAVLTSISLSVTRRDRHWAAIMIWILPVSTAMLD
ncbi:hypothetical protein ACJZ2D_009338 [Fusarium nematophilum]